MKRISRKATPLSKPERTIQAGLGVFESVVESLAIIKERKLFRAYGDFQTYLHERWEPHFKKTWQHKYSRQHLFRLTKAIEVRENLSPIGNVTGLKESQARVLSQADPEEQRQAWSKAKEEEAAGGQPATAKRLQELLDKAGDPPGDDPKVSAVDQALLRLDKGLVKLRQRTQELLGDRAAGPLGLLDDYWDKVTELMAG
jgi:hypothetical protein